MGALFAGCRSSVVRGPEWRTRSRSRACSSANATWLWTVPVAHSHKGASALRVPCHCLSTVKVAFAYLQSRERERVLHRPYSNSSRGGSAITYRRRQIADGPPGTLTRRLPHALPASPLDERCFVVDTVPRTRLGPSDSETGHTASCLCSAACLAAPARLVGIPK